MAKWQRIQAWTWYSLLDLRVSRFVISMIDLHGISFDLLQPRDAETGGDLELMPGFINKMLHSATQ